MYSTFTPLHRGGHGTPLVCVHGFTDTWRTWELVLPVLERHHDVLAPTLLGHAGAPPITSEVSAALDAERITCPVRIVWGAEDKLLPWPSAAARFRDGWLPQADWVVLDDVGHCPQLDVPLETAHLVVEFTAR